VHKNLFLKEPGLSTCTCAKLILSFVQEMGVRPDLQRGWSTQQNLFLSFLICEVKTGPTFKFFFLCVCFSFCTIFNSESQCIKICLGTKTVYMYMHWMDLVLCTGDGCKTWPTKGLVHPTKSLSELFDLWSKDWSYPQVFFFPRNFQQ